MGTKVFVEVNFPPVLTQGFKREAAGRVETRLPSGYDKTESALEKHPIALAALIPSHLLPRRGGEDGPNVKRLNRRPGPQVGRRSPRPLASFDAAPLSPAEREHLQT